MNHLKKIIFWVRFQLYAKAFLVCLLLSFSAFFLISTLTNSQLWVKTFTFFSFVIAAFLTKLFENKISKTYQLLHQKLKNTEYSLEIFRKKFSLNENLSIAEQMQLKRLISNNEHQKIPFIISQGMLKFLVIFLLSISIFDGVNFLKNSKTPLSNKIKSQAQITDNKAFSIKPFIQKLIITPPSYTQLPSRESKDLNCTAPFGSTLKWQISFHDSKDLIVKLSNQNGQELAFKKIGTSFEYSDKLLNSGFYSLKVYNKGLTKGANSLIYQSDFYRLEALSDLAPKIEPTSKELFTYFHLNDEKKIQISAEISDDFLVNQAFIVATLARGSGESVKFREVKIPLDQSHFKEKKLTKTIDLSALNFAPGDELYYYWAAIDNKNPEPNFTKTDTYFIVFKDTSQVDEADLASMAMNIMPEYFRSQRQIIIDTEKLLAQQSNISKQEFMRISNEIGFDQKALRLRYGQYLGEEFENSLGGHSEITAGFEQEKNENHEENKQKPNEKDNISSVLKEFTHAHDDGDAATFYEESTKSLLKMSLEQMWQSELNLRTYEPKKALPFEYKALEYLKNAQFKARAFVKKTSFEAPPIKEKEKRLTGELKKFNNNYVLEKKLTNQQIENLLAEVMAIIENKKIGILPLQDKQKVMELEQYLSTKIINSSLSNWSILRLLQELRMNNGLNEPEKLALKSKLYELFAVSLPQKSTISNRSYVPENKLEQAYWRNIKP